MKTRSRPQRVRQRQILELIRQGSRTGEFMNTKSLGEAVGVSRRTVHADLDSLRDDDRAPIDYDPSGYGYCLTDVTWDLPPLQVSRQELFAFSVAAKLLDAFRGTPLEVDMHSVMAKIQQSLEGKVTVDAAALTDRFAPPGGVVCSIPDF